MQVHDHRTLLLLRAPVVLLLMVMVVMASSRMKDLRGQRGWMECSGLFQA